MYAKLSASENPMCILFMKLHVLTMLLCNWQILHPRKQ